MNEQESEQLAKSIGNVAQYYPVYIDPKMQAWAGLAMVAGSLYGSRFIAYGARMKAEKNAPQPVPEAQPANPPGMTAFAPLKAV